MSVNVVSYTVPGICSCDTLAVILLMSQRRHHPIARLAPASCADFGWSVLIEVIKMSNNISTSFKDHDTRADLAIDDNLN